MKILRVESGEYETIYTDAKPKEAGVYRRIYTEGEFPTFSWEHQIDRNGGTWLRLFDETTLEEAYQEFMRKQSGG